MTYDEKYRQVAAWWDDFRFQLAMAVKSPSELNRFLAGSLRRRRCTCFRRPARRGCPSSPRPITSRCSTLRATATTMPPSAVTSSIRRSWSRPTDGFAPGSVRGCRRGGQAQCRRVAAARRTQHPPPLSGGGDPDSRHDEPRLRRAVRFVPADVRFPERTPQFRIRGAAPQRVVGPQTAPADELFRGGHSAARHPSSRAATR